MSRFDFNTFTKCCAVLEEILKVVEHPINRRIKRRLTKKRCFPAMITFLKNQQTAKTLSKMNINKAIVKAIHCGSYILLSKSRSESSRAKSLLNPIVSFYLSALSYSEIHSVKNSRFLSALFIQITEFSFILRPFPLIRFLCTLSTAWYMNG